MIRCFIDNQEIDLVYESQIAISLSIASVTQVETGRTGYSKTIRVPMTVRNNSILGNAAEIHSPEMFNQMAHTARIEADGRLGMVPNQHSRSRQRVGPVGRRTYVQRDRHSFRNDSQRLHRLPKLEPE